MKKCMVVALGMVMSGFSFGQMPQLKKVIDAAVNNKRCVVGVALYDFATGDTLSVNGSRRFPMQSVFKFPIALAMMEEVGKGAFTLRQEIVMGEEDRRRGLWSPIEKRFPEGDIRLPLSEIIHYSVAQSDNMACDVLLKLLGGPSTVNEYIHRKGVADIQIEINERQMQSEWNSQFRNWTTPEAMIQLLRLFHDKRLLSGASHEFLWEVMANTSTGSVRNKLPKGTFVAYKTGTSGYNSEGMSAATNCVGILKRASGEMVAFAIFITNSWEPAEVNAEVIADIAAALYAAH